MYGTLRAVQQSLRPILGSAASFLCSAFIIHYFACWLDPSFTLFATRSVGKLALMWAALVQVGWFIALQPSSFTQSFWHDAVTWPLRLKEWRPFFYFFLTCAALHILVLDYYHFFGHATWQQEQLLTLLKRWPVLLVGLLATFLLAWAEELIFRGFLFGYLYKTIPLHTSAIISAFIFALTHDLENPTRLLANQWQLGLGLFLLGLLLTYIRIWRDSIAAGAGAHAGLVMVKVFLRKIDLLPIAAGSQYLFPIDLRESLIVHALLIGAIIVIRRQTLHHTGLFQK